MVPKLTLARIFVGCFQWQCCRERIWLSEVTALINKVICRIGCHACGLRKSVTLMAAFFILVPMIIVFRLQSLITLILETEKDTWERVLMYSLTIEKVQNGNLIFDHIGSGTHCLFKRHAC